ncbi:hypothetical protein NP493_198g00036 [Ridgeia piscesae]|uniref:BPTI/Kunitz inhibitor domain-containing protein n=1 Tax=Ridgeia piscesae TaxID=27915 RepID=A0AAD9UEM4_RIDPI|nr:hypothetical protein NP493_198g00036 [Ridgeia piscesae]
MRGEERRSERRCEERRDDVSRGESIRRCAGFSLRWFFNTKTGRCERFLYGGCAGNANNFKTKEECHKTCWCPPMCYCYCQFGFQHDEFGCTLCREFSVRRDNVCSKESRLQKKTLSTRDTVLPDPNCCNGQPYDHVKQICCQRRLYKREDDVDCCMVDSIYRVNKPYNVVKEICCQGVVQSRPCNAKCCDKKAYNSLTEVCCDGVLQERPPHPKCCGKKAYDSRKFVCCGGRVQQRPDNAFG